MTAWLRTFLRLQSGDAGRLAWFALLGALLQGGLAIGISAADSLFLVRLGVEHLPVIYVLMPVIMLSFLPVYSLLVARVGVNRVFQLTLAVLTAGGILFALLFGFLGAHAPAICYYLVKLYATLWWIALYTLYWNFVDGYFDILDAKRVYALLSAASAAGAGLGGLLVAELSRYLAVPQLFLAWSTLAILAIPVLVLILRRGSALEETDGAEEAAGAGPLAQLRQTSGVIRRSRFALLLTSVLFLTLIVTALCEYQSLGVLSAQRTDRQLAELFGRLFAGVGVLNVIINLFLFNRIVARIGVRNTALIQPAAYLIVFLGFLLDGSYAAALLGFFAYQGLLVTIEYNNVNFLINALPTGTKKTLRTFIEGICEPVATAVAGLFLLAFANRLGADHLSLIGLLAALATLLLVLCLRAEYVRAMVANLKRGWLDFSRPLAAVMSRRPDPELAWLEQTARRAAPDQALLAIRLLWLNDKYRATDCLLAFLTPPAEERCRAAQPLLAQMLAEEDHEIMRRILAWINDRSEALGPTLLEELGPRGLVATQELQSGLHARAPGLRAAAASALTHSWRVGEGVAALQALDRLLRGSPVERRAAVRGLGRCGERRYAHFLVPLLRVDDAATRGEALDAMRRLGGREATRLLPALLEVLRTGTRTERLPALGALARIGDPDCIAPLLDASPAFFPAELREAEALLLDIGSRGVPALVSCLVQTGNPYPGRALAARALAHISFTQFESVYPALIDAEIDRANGFYQRHFRLLGGSAETTAGRGVLGRFYGDLPETVIDFILELLGLGGRLPDFESATAALRSRNAKDRANAIETIEQACPRAVFTRLLPLLDGRARAGPVAASAPGEDAIVREACRSRFVIEAAAGLQMRWEQSAADARAGIRERLAQTDPSAALSPFLLALLARIAAEPAGAEMNLVEKIHALGRAVFFRGLRIEELALLAELARPAAVESGSLPSSDPPVPRFGLVLAGEVRVGPARQGPGEVFGAARLWHGAAPAEPVADRPLRALLFEVAAVLELAGFSTRIALALLNRKWEDRDAA